MALMASFLWGCTVAVPEVSNLSSTLPFSSKSQNPFQQDKPGNYVVFSGICLPGVTGFELRLDDLSLWTPIPSEAPLPSAGEYLSEDLQYDVDCSNGTFSFYSFHSLIMSNYALNGSGNEDPYKIELRPISDFPLPSIIFERPSPVGFDIQVLGHNMINFSLEAETQMPFNVVLIDASGQDTRPGALDIPFTLTLDNLTTPGNPTGQLFKSDCSTNLTDTDTTMRAANGDREKELCFKAPVVTSPEVIQLTVASENLLVTTFKIYVYPSDSAILTLNSAYSNLPPHFVKGVEYRLKMEMAPLTNMLFSIAGRYVNGFDGDFYLTANSSTIQFKAVSPSDPHCPTSFVSSPFFCENVSGTTKDFFLKIPDSFTGTAVTLTSSAVPKASCPSCEISDGSLKPILAYVPGQLQLPVVDGGASFAKPYFDGTPGSFRKTIDVNECRNGVIGSANFKGNVIPDTEALSWTISSPTGIVQFFPDYSDCTNSINGTSTVTISMAYEDLLKHFYYKVSSVPGDGKVQFKSNSIKGSWEFDYYVESD